LTDIIGFSVIPAIMTLSAFKTADILDVFAKYILFIFIEISGFCTMFRGVVVDVIVW
jgi:hypothetical protein